MKNNWIGVFILIAITFSPLTKAGCTSIGCVGVGSAAVKRVMPISSGQVYLEAPADKSNLNCSLQGGNHMVIEASNPNKNIFVSTLLTSIALGKSIRIRIEEGSSNCKVVYVWMDS